MKFQETAEGNLIHLLHEVSEVLNKKFFTRTISFEGLFRIEKGEYPVYDNRFSSRNEGLLAQGLSLESINRQHPSPTRNLLIAMFALRDVILMLGGGALLRLLTPAGSRIARARNY